MLSMGPSACFIDRVEPIGAIMDRLVAEAASARARLDGLMPAMARANPGLA
jgi:nitronate monooxygenase